MCLVRAPPRARRRRPQAHFRLYLSCVSATPTLQPSQLKHLLVVDCAATPAALEERLLRAAQRRGASGRTSLREPCG